MRITPILFNNNYIRNNGNNKGRTSFVRQNDVCNICNRDYTGVASVDLALASLRDKSIADDLRKMGLIN